MCVGVYTTGGGISYFQSLGKRWVFEPTSFSVVLPGLIGLPLPSAHHTFLLPSHPLHLPSALPSQTCLLLCFSACGQAVLVWLI